MKQNNIKKGIAIALVAVTLSISVIPYLPPDLLNVWAFHLTFRNSGDTRHPDLFAQIPGEGRETGLFCLNEGASAKSSYDYYKVDADVNYSKGSLEEKRLFWAYIGTHGSANGNPSLINTFGQPLIGNTMQGKQVAWSKGKSNGGSDWIETMATDGFMSLANIPTGCKSPQDIFSAVSSYSSPDDALWIGKLQKGPGEIDGQKLYDIAGISDWDSFQKYCTVESTDPNVEVQFTEYNINYSRAVASSDPIILKVTYDPTIFKMFEVTGKLEYYKCNESGSQQLYRAMGKVEEKTPVFYISSQYNPTIPTGGDTPETIEVTVYEHEETFESNYLVDLKKKDYETDYPLKGTIWEVLEKFDASQLSSHEEGGSLVEENMRERPTTWTEWLVFNDDLETDTDGYISHADKRYYDFNHKYCDGHPIPPEPEDSGEGEEDEAEEDNGYESLVEQWQAAVDECQQIADASGGTFHHWECNSESLPDEEEAFEYSGCKDARDSAYQNFINLEYSYTFRETNARDGYILHNPNGHPDDVPIEIITTASSESGTPAKWTSVSNGDISVTGYVRNFDWSTGHRTGTKVTRKSENISITETYDLNFSEKLSNSIRRIFGLPEKYVSQQEYTIQVSAADSVPIASDSNAYEEDWLDDLATPSQATYSNASYQFLAQENRESNGIIATQIASKEGGTYIDLDNAVKDSQPNVSPGQADRTAHTFIVYNHRVPGQIHFNKRDLELADGENDDYGSYADTQGDATLEGAVYGLFAADAVYLPDTQRTENGSVIQGSGVLFDANDLVAVGVTDKNGDGSFLVITEIPHSTYNYGTGQIEYSGKEYPINLYDKDGYVKVNDNEEVGRIYNNNLEINGDYWIGRPLVLGNYYIKELSRSEGYELSITGKDMELTNVQDTNRGNYGEQDVAKTSPVGSAWIVSQLSHAVTFPEGNDMYGNRENLLNLEVASNNATDGFNVVLDGIPEDADFYFNDVITNPVTIQVPIGGEWVNATEAPLYETAKDSQVYKRDINGNKIENPDAVKTHPIPYVGVGEPVKKQTPEGSAVPSDLASYQAAFSNADSNMDYVKYELEQMMRQLGMETPKDSGDYSEIGTPVYDEAGNESYGMPEVTLEISGVTTNASFIEAILNFYTSEEIFTYGSLQEAELIGTTVKATIAVGMTPKKTLLYDTDASGNIIAAYLFKINEATNRYVMREYTGLEIVATRVPDITSERYYLQLTPDFVIAADGIPEDVFIADNQELYLHYETGDTLYDYWYQDGSGNWVGHAPVKRKVYQTIYENQIVEEKEYQTSRITQVAAMEEVADPMGSTYVVYDELSRQYTLHVGSIDVDLTGNKTFSFTIALPDGSTVITQNDIAKIGSNNVWGYKAGDTLNHSAYTIRISGAGAGVFTSKDFNQKTSYIKNQRLIYNGNYDLCEDGNTKEKSNVVNQRIIKQQMKVTKTIDIASYDGVNSYSEIHSDWFTRLFGGFTNQKQPSAKIDNFRFKTYLKSNLEGLYRNEAGEIVWVDRSGKTIDILVENQVFPELVNKIYTKVLHDTENLYKDSRDGILVNKALYDFTGEFIHENQNPGYTAVLETIETLVEDGASIRMVKAYNYDKFFDAIAVANHDKWKDGTPTYTSHQPIGNEANQTIYTLENAKASDMVRQFAIDWYLEAEVLKLIEKVPQNEQENQVEGGSVSFADELYDEALYYAIKKTNNYLLPFFSYDLDTIYAIEWDSEEQGGSDRDLTTLSADTLFGKSGDDDGYFFGTSAYLPYGTYIVVEQQPRYAELEDFKNKHYQIDRPKEVSLPAVYESYEGSQASPEILNPYYNYDHNIAQSELERKYKIRFNEEDLHVIKGRNTDGDFEVYKYGMDINHISNDVTSTGEGDYFALTQSEFKPYKNYYNPEDNQTTGDIPYYLSEGMSGREAVSKYYRYSSVAEYKGLADDVVFSGGAVTQDNPSGTYYQDQITTMQGIQTAYDGTYASMLVPWTVIAPENSTTEVGESQTEDEGQSSYYGFGYGKFINRFSSRKLRIEKLDSETHENILHDDAIFNIYAAKRNDSMDGDGEVLFYERDTTIIGSREFLEAMCAAKIVPVNENTYQGVVSAGTPICEEVEQIILMDEKGNQTGAFKSHTTALDGEMKDKYTNTTLSYQSQTVGYVETPQPLGSGVYVLAEAKAPAGYNRTKPIAIEIYSDKVTYYKEGNKDDRVLAAIYEYPSDHQTTNGNKPQDVRSTARIHVENAPIKLTVEKVKESSKQTAETTADKTVTYKVGTRVDGALVEIGNNPDYEYAYEKGDYLGYAWKKGTLEYLASRKEAGEQVEIVYEGGVFAGYGLVTKTLETANDNNPYVVGATMTLFEALELLPSGNTEDYAYEGLQVERNRNNNITRMYVKEGYAGERVEFIQDMDELGTYWTAKYIQRPETDILYYDLDKLDIMRTEKVDGRQILYGYDADYHKVSIAQMESDKVNYPKTDTEYSIYAFKGGAPFLEFVGGDFTQISYLEKDKVIQVGSGTLVYHLDREGNRDALVDPYTGMAYVLEALADGGQKVLVWPVNLAEDAYGNIIARDKITTSRLATLGENQKNEYITGSWMSEAGEESHLESSIHKNAYGQNMNDDVLISDNNGLFEKHLNPVYDQHGLPVYYQRSEEIYGKGTELYDRNGDLVRDKESDHLEDYNQASYTIDSEMTLHNVEDPLYHRQGEGYVLENTWITSDQTPNNPFHTLETDGQVDVLKRIPVGTYVMEELIVPDGYLKGMPTGITVMETPGFQNVKMIDKTTKIEISKVDEADNQTHGIIQMETKASLGTLTEGKGTYGHSVVEDAELSLFAAQRKYTTDYENYPNGYYLEKQGLYPITYEITDSTAGNKKRQTARWKTGSKPIYLEGIPEGDYLLEETITPDGFVTSEPLEVVITNTRDVQIVIMNNDHTKIEIEKYQMDGTEKVLVNGAGFTLYKAITNSQGDVVYEDGKSQYDESQVVDEWKSCDGELYGGFMTAFETMYQSYGTQPDTSVAWQYEGRDYYAHYVSHIQVDASISGGGNTDFPTTATMMFKTNEEKLIRITVYQEQQDRSGRKFTFEYQFDYHELDSVNDYAASYVTLDGMRRLDYLLVGSAYVLVETTVPEGYAKAENLVIVVKEMTDVQRYSVENIEGTLMISKVVEGDTKEQSGAVLGLFRAGALGELIQEPSHQVAQWITGRNGVYTELDAINGRIPDGYKKGDLKPHFLKGLPDGDYWLVELESPAYYTIFEPVFISYKQEDEIRIVRVSNQLAEGELEVKKTDKEDELLSGVVFELSAYRKSNLRNPVFNRNLSDSNGLVKVTGLPVGDVLEDGQVEPYVYKLKELIPPEGYAASPQIYTFSFSTDKYIYEEIQVVNEKTKIRLLKKDFEGAFIQGAEMGVFHVAGRDQEDHYIYDENNPIETWLTSQENPEHVLEGLIAGQTYLLVELQAPDGYERILPIAFTLSSDGRKIASISNRLNTITVNSLQPEDEMLDTENLDVDSIQSVTIQGRYAVKVLMEVTDDKGNIITSWIANGSGHILYPESGIIDGSVYSIAERTIYSDGSVETTGRTTRRITLTEEGNYYISDRTVEEVRLALSHADGTLIESFRSTEQIGEMTIKNNISPENPKITVKNQNGQSGDALDAAQPVVHHVAYANTSNSKLDMELMIQVSDGAQIIDAGNGILEGKRLKYIIRDVKPLECGYITFITEIDRQAQSEQITATLKFNGETMISSKEVPVLQKNQLTIYNELTGSGKRMYGEEESQFKVRLFTQDGEELKGTYIYQGSRQGNIKSGDTVTLAGNEFITINPGQIYKNIRYQVTRAEDGKVVTSWNTEGQVMEETGACAVFTRAVVDTSERILFTKGSSYELAETTQYSDGEILQSNKIQFTLNDQASIDEITGLDKKHRIEVSKVDITGEAEVEGALLQVIDLTEDEETILEEWISSKEPHIITAALKLGKTYILREEYAPDGFAYAVDIEFTVSETGIDRVVMVDDVTKLEVLKVNQDGKILTGAKFQLLTLEEILIEEWKSTETAHQIYGTLNAGESYILREIEAPAGYIKWKEDILVTIPEDGSVVTVAVENTKKPGTPGGSKETIRFKKISTEGIPLSGAEFTFYDANGMEFAKAISNAQGIFKIELPPDGEYAYQETKAPEGYLLNQEIYYFTILYGTVITQINPIINHKNPEEIEVPKGKIGKVIASYNRDQSESGRYPLGNPKAGDSNLAIYYVVVFLLSLLALAIMFAVQKKKKTAGILLFIVISILLIIAKPIYGYASVETEKIFYEIEHGDSIPETITIDSVSIPLKEFAHEKYYWIEGFEFLIMVEDADAAYYELGNRLVLNKEENPFDGFEVELLDLIGVSPEFYQINSVQWVGEPWQQDNGIIYRQAVAKGMKKIATVGAVYEGNILFPSVAETETMVEVLYKEMEESEIKAIRTEVQNSVASETWIERLLHGCLVSIGLLVLIGFVIWLVYKVRKKK